MKSKDIALIAIIVFISVLLSWYISGLLFNGPKHHQQTAEVVQTITSDFPQPDAKYFNSSAFDPTKPISVGQSSNQNPFSSTTH